MVIGEVEAIVQRFGCFAEGDFAILVVCSGLGVLYIGLLLLLLGYGGCVFWELGLFGDGFGVGTHVLDSEVEVLFGHVVLR